MIGVGCGGDRRRAMGVGAGRVCLGVGGLVWWRRGVAGVGVGRRAAGLVAERRGLVAGGLALLRRGLAWLGHWRLGKRLGLVLEKAWPKPRLGPSHPSPCPLREYNGDPNKNKMLFSLMKYRCES